MSDKKLKQLLLQVQEQLQQQDDLDNETQALLHKILSDVEGEVNVDADDLNQDLTDRIEEQAVQFEQEHPTLSAVLRQVMDTLGRIGI